MLRLGQPIPYRSLRAPYRYLTGSGHAFRPMFMRVLTGLTGPAPQGGVPRPGILPRQGFRTKAGPRSPRQLITDY